MFTLIKKEMQDNIFWITAMTALVTIWFVIFYFSGNMFGNITMRILMACGFSSFFMMGVSFMLGVSQSSIDVSGKVSAFMMGRPVTRRQLYLARVIVGISAAIGINLIGCFLTCIMINGVEYYDNYFGFSCTLAVKYYSFAALASLACYGHGLIWGGYSEKDVRIIFAIVGGMILNIVPLYLVYQKGMTPVTALILIGWAGIVLFLGYDKYERKAM